MRVSLRVRNSRILYRWIVPIYIDRYTPKSIERFIVTADGWAQYSRHRTKVMRLKTRCAVLLFVLAVSAVSAFAVDPALSLDQHVVRTWGVDEGLPQGTVYALTQTADGYVWAATQEGFVRFDGTDFVVYDKAASLQIKSNITHALLAARDGSLYAATNGGGVVQIDAAGRIRSYGVADGLPTDAAVALVESGNGAVWIGTQRGLARRQSDGRIV